MFVIEGLQFGVGDLHLLHHFLGGEDRIRELHFKILLEIVLLHCGFRHRDVALHHRDQFGDQQLFFHQVLELRDAHTEVLLDKVLVICLSNEFAFWEQCLSELSLMQEVTNFFVGCLQAQPARFSDERVLGHKLIRGLRANKRNEFRRQALLTCHLLSRAINVSRGHIVPANTRINPATGGIRKAVEDAGNQRDDHHHGDHDQQASQNEFLRPSGRLQKLNHCLWMHSGQDCRIFDYRGNA